MTRVVMFIFRGLPFALALSTGACSHASAADTAAASIAPKVHVQTAVVTEQSVPSLLRLTGVLSSNERTDLAANAAGRVVKTFVERGDHVASGGDPRAARRALGGPLARRGRGQRDERHRAAQER